MTFVVDVNGLSEPGKTCGVRQGSILGPFFSTISMSTICLNRFLVSYSFVQMIPALFTQTSVLLLKNLASWPVCPLLFKRILYLIPFSASFIFT